MIRTILVEDQSLVRASLKSILGHHGLELVGETALGHEVVGLVEKHRPNLILLDLALPDVDGVQVIRQLRLNGHQTPVLVITGEGTAFRLKSSMQAGANGFITKAAPVEELVQAAQTVACGGLYITPGVVGSSTGSISARQQHVLEGVVYGLTNDQIATRMHISRGTVKVEINSLFVTLRCSDRTHLACEAALQGLVTTPRQQHPLFADAG